jgi:hypothetical protein
MVSKRAERNDDAGWHLSSHPPRDGSRDYLIFMRCAREYKDKNVSHEGCAEERHVISLSLMMKLSLGQ